MTMEEFSDGHEFTSHDLPSDRHAWWVGRLVKAKYEIFRGLTISNYKSRKIAEGTIGIVVDVHPAAYCCGVTHECAVVQRGAAVV